MSQERHKPMLFFLHATRTRSPVKSDHNPKDGQPNDSLLFAGNGD
jgi:hypothetical protein